MSRPRVVLLIKRTSYRQFVEDERDARVKRLLAAGDPTVRRMRGAHDDHEATVAGVRRALEDLGADVDERVGARSRIEGACDLVVTVGGDGTLLAASHQLSGAIPLLGVNSSPAHSVGFFCAARLDNARATIEAALARELPGAVLQRMRVERNGALLSKRVLNEALFCHASPAATTRYILETRDGPVDGKAGATASEEQKSSGLWIGPAAGSTAAQRSAGGERLPLFSKTIQYVVREAYVPLGHELSMPRGVVEAGGAVVLRSKIRDAKLFLDGHHTVHDVTIGDVVTMTLSDEPLVVAGLVPPSDP